MGQTLQKSNGHIVFSHQLIEQFCGGDSVVDNMPRTLLNVPIRGRSLEEHGPSPSRPIAPLTRALSRLARGTQRARGRKHGITASKCGGKSQGEGSKASSDTGWDRSRASLNFRFLHRVLMRVQEVTHLILWSAVRGGGGMEISKGVLDLGSSSPMLLDTFPNLSAVSPARDKGSLYRPG